MAVLFSSSRRTNYNLRNFAEDSFEESFEKIVREAKPKWSEQQKAVFVRWAGATTVDALKQATPQTTNQSVVDLINLTARRIVFQNAQRSQHHSATIDRDWLRNLAMEAFFCMPLERNRLRNRLQVYINNPQLAQDL